MAEQPSIRSPNIAPNGTELAFERTMLAHERTLMAWVRTAISMISFGFTIYKFFQEVSRMQPGQQRILSPRLVGMTMIAFGLLCLLLAQVQHLVAVKKIRRHYPDLQRSISSVLGIIVLVFGLALFLGALFGQ